MDGAAPLSSAQIRAARLKQDKLRPRDLADKLGISEARLLSADLGHGRVTRIAAEPDLLMPALERLGEVMALTRNDSCVIEKVGTFANYQSGEHAALVVNEEIDLRLFPRHWLHGYAIERDTEYGPRHSLQVFDAAGDAVFKVFLRDRSNIAEWASVLGDLRLADQSEVTEYEPRQPTEGAMGDPAKADELRTRWDKLTDTHQFLMMVRRLKMNRLGAYRMAGQPYATELKTSVIDTILNRAADDQTPIMFFVGNMGCIEIHTGPIEKVKPMGPWLNVLDPRFNLHLRGDHIAEVWAVRKATRAGDALSIEAFDAEGMLITQIFGVLRGEDKAAAWNRMFEELCETESET